MITRDNFKDLVLTLPEDDRQRILMSDKEFCVLLLSVFNSGSIVNCILTNNYSRYQNVSNNGNCIVELNEVADIIKDDNSTNRISRNIAENIANFFLHLDGPINRKAIFRHYRNTDESHLWPVSNRFNCTERAIQHLYKYERESGDYLLGLELCYFLDGELSTIVNQAV
jgi:hypothetical protein